MNKRKKTALVTGATSGIGKDIARALAKAGYEVMALGRNRACLEQLQSVDGLRPLAFDITDQEGLNSTLKDENIDILVNNAGVIPSPQKFDQMNQSEIDATLEVNLIATLAITRLILPGMLKRKHGHIFFVGSISGHTPFSNMAVYGASKAAIASFAAALRCDISGSGVRVTEIVAGRVKTNLYNKVMTDQDRNELYSTFDPVEPRDVASMLLSVLQMPEHVNVTRFDILPTAQFVGGGGISRDET